MMKKHKIIFLLSIIFLGAFTLPKTQSDPIPLAPLQYRKPDHFKKEAFPYSLAELKEQFSEEMMEQSAEVYRKVQLVNEQGKWKPTPESIDEHKAPEWFLDAKFGMFIDWGPWSIAGWAPKRETGAMYPDWYEFRLDTDSTFMSYHQKNWGPDFTRDDFLPLFQAREYDPEKLVSIAKKAGMKYIVPFCKHHGGFCLWPSSFTKRDVGDMGPKRDLIKPLIENCREQGLKFGFYFSIEEWEYPLIGDDHNIKPRFWAYDTRWDVRPQPTLEELDDRASGKIAVKDFTRDYLIPQAVEFIDNYDPDILWYDGEWITEQEVLKTYEIASYFYNQAEGRKEVAVNDRYGTENGNRLRFVRGDFYTSEYHSLGEDKQSSHAWEECRGISQSFGFNWQDTEKNVISSKAFIDMFVEIVANGGNLLLIVNLDGQGKLPDIQENRLNDIGKWLEVNGEGIYSTRPYKINSEGSVSYTQSTDGKSIYAIMKKWPGEEITLNALLDEEIAAVNLLGYTEHLQWDKTNDHIKVKLPAKLSGHKENLPCDYAWILKFNIKARTNRSL